MCSFCSPVLDQLFVVDDLRDRVKRVCGALSRIYKSRYNAERSNQSIGRTRLRQLREQKLPKELADGTISAASRWADGRNAIRAHLPRDVAVAPLQRVLNATMA